MIRRRPLFGTPDTALPAKTLAVDGALPGEAVYSHWHGAPPTPPEIAADTATGILVRAARAPETWLEPYAQVAIDHLDADGLLAVLVACRPELVADPHRAALVVAAAECGDFSAWHGADAYRLMLALHRRITRQRARGGAWEQRCLDEVVDDGERLLAEYALPDGERAAQTARVENVREHLRRQDGYRVGIAGDLGCVAWTRRHGHADDFLVTRRDDDLPPQALDGLFTETAFQLLSMRVGDRWCHQLDASRHSWARTVVRPRVAWPELTAMAAALAVADPTVAWATVPTSAGIGFTCVLASVDAQGRWAASHLPPERIAAAWGAR